MRLSAFAVIAASAVLAQVSAAPTPLRLLVVASSVEEDSPFRVVRFGHAVPSIDRELLNSNSPPASLPAPTPAKPVPSKRFRHRTGCHGRKAKVGILVHKFKLKAIKIGNCFRKALGWPLIEIKHHHHHHGHPPHISKDEAGRDDNFVGILPFPPVTAAKGGDWAGDMSDRPHMHHKHRGSFLSRLHHSLMNLGRWEGRAVAFVIGCGIGVLIRMFWVLAIVSYRACRGHRDNEYTTVAVMEEYDSDDETVISVSSPKIGPPVYIYPIDEKIAVEEVN